jgi:hypothetical protein
MASLHLRRPRAYADRGTAYRVEVDGRRVGKLEDDGHLTVEVEAGRHEVMLRCFGLRSRALELEVGPDERVELVGEPHDPDDAGGVLKRMFTARDDYMVLRRVDG